MWNCLQSDGMSKKLCWACYLKDVISYSLHNTKWKITLLITQQQKHLVTLLFTLVWCLSHKLKGFHILYLICVETENERLWFNKQVVSRLEEFTDQQLT